MIRRLWLAIIVMVILAGSAVVLAQDTPLTATTTAELNVRVGPGREHPRLVILNPRTALIVEGRNEAADWLLVRTSDGSTRGWVAIGFVQFDRETRVTDLPVSTERFAQQVAVPAGATPGANPPPVDPNENPFVLVEDTDFPTLNLTAAVLRNARAIFNRGQRLGNSAASFMKIGESNTGGTVYMCNFEWGKYDLGTYTYLQGIVDMFNQTLSFCRNNITAGNGFSTATVLDSTWSPQDVCEANESPLACEIRRSRPGYAFIYMGIADMATLTEREFRNNLTTMVRTLSGQGVIPILSTFAMADQFNDGKPQAFNTIVREVARRQTVPLIDLRAATFNYENRGTGEDGYHLSVIDTETSAFTGDEQRYGRPLRELLTLEVLYQLNNAMSQ